jgi:quercetin dioxygenase-like cupin family protein
MITLRPSHTRENPEMEILQLDPELAKPIGTRPYEVNRAASLEVAHGEGEAHAYVIRFEPGGEIGPHEAGFAQLFLAVSGSGWAAGEDGARVALPQGHAAFFNRGEIHSKGSDGGMTAFMLQVRDLDPVGRI